MKWIEEKRIFGGDDGSDSENGYDGECGCAIGGAVGGDIIVPLIMLNLFGDYGGGNGKCEGDCNGRCVKFGDGDDRYGDDGDESECGTG